jgi:ankyrin repeat protein
VGWSGSLLGLSVCSFKNKHEITKILIDEGLDLNATDEYGRTPINSAISTMQVEKYGFSLNEILTLLVKKGANLNHRDNKGRTPLEYAEEYGIKRAVEILRPFYKDTK